MRERERYIQQYSVEHEVLSYALVRMVESLL